MNAFREQKKTRSGDGAGDSDGSGGGGGGVVLEQKFMLMEAVRTEMANVDSLRRMKKKHLEDKVPAHSRVARGVCMCVETKLGTTFTGHHFAPLSTIPRFA